MKETVLDELRRQLPARVPQPRRRDRGLPRADRGATSSRSWRSNSTAARSPGRPPHHARDQRRSEDHIVRAGYEPAYGARPLKRAIQKEVETALGRKILAGEVRDGRPCASITMRTRRIDVPGRVSPRRAEGRKPPGELPFVWLQSPGGLRLSARPEKEDTTMSFFDPGQRYLPARRFPHAGR